MVFTGKVTLLGHSRLWKQSPSLESGPETSRGAACVWGRASSREWGLGSPEAAPAQCSVGEWGGHHECVKSLRRAQMVAAVMQSTPSTRLLPGNGGAGCGLEPAGEARPRWPRPRPRAGPELDSVVVLGGSRWPGPSQEPRQTLLGNAPEWVFASTREKGRLSDKTCLPELEEPRLRAPPPVNLRNLDSGPTSPPPGRLSGTSQFLFQAEVDTGPPPAVGKSGCHLPLAL